MSEGEADIMPVNVPEQQNSIARPPLSTEPIEPKPEKHPVRRRIRRSLMSVAVLTVLLGVGTGVFLRVMDTQQQEALSQLQTVGVKRVTLPVTVSANGSVEPEQSTNVSPKTSGRLQQVLVNEGDAVKAGQILAYMDASDLEGQRLQAEGQLKSAEASLALVRAGNRPQEVAQAEAEVASAIANLRQAEEDWQRYEQLLQEGAISAQEASTYRTSRDSAQANVDAATEALSLVRAGSRSEEIAQAQAQVIQAEGNLATIQTQIEDATIRAPFSGIITARYADPGDFVAPTTSASSTSSATSSSILTLASTYQMVANVAEMDIAKIQLGQSVTITTDAYPDRTFQGRVAQIAEQATVTANVTSFEVRVNINDSQHLLIPGMNGSLEFQVGERSNALVVPTVAIVRQDDGEGIMVMTPAGIPRIIPIETGLTVGNETEVIAGLNGNEQIVINAVPPSEDATRRAPSLLPPMGGPPPGGRP